MVARLALTNMKRQHQPRHHAHVQPYNQVMNKLIALALLFGLSSAPAEAGILHRLKMLAAAPVVFPIAITKSVIDGVKYGTTMGYIVIEEQLDWRLKMAGY